TRVLIKISQIITSPWVLLIIAFIVGGIIGLRKWISTEDGRRKWDRLILKPPVFGPLIHKVALARVTNTLASLISSGVPILESLDICSDIAGNRTVGDVLIDAKNGVRVGRPLADPLREHEDVIPPLVVQMIEVGEQTGALDGMLKKVAEFYDQEIEVTVNNLTALLEPLLTIVMGAGVGAMVICLYLPMFDYIKLIHN
ncbi:MAG TPA: type II secretion system F family protein, partial [Acidimicrobiales bacterium]|nr:type II secretion system F family protein [Acidimicrobiales bacterium]